MSDFMYWRDRADAHQTISSQEMQEIEDRLNEYQAKKDYYVQSAQEPFEIARILFEEVQRLSSPLVEH